MKIKLKAFPIKRAVILALLSGTLFIMFQNAGIVPMGIPSVQSNIVMIPYGHFQIPIVARQPPQGITFSNFAGENYKMDPYLNLQIGAGWVRINMNWFDIQTTSDPNPAHWSWSIYDKYVLSSQANGQQVLATMWGTPSWANSASCTQGEKASNPCYDFPPDPTNLQLQVWSSFVAAFVAHYSAAPFNVKYFQIWNEPCADQGFSVSDGGNCYQEFVQDIYNPAAHQIHNAAIAGLKVVFGGWGGGGGTSITNSNQTGLDDTGSILNYSTPANGAAWQNTDYMDLHYVNLSDFAAVFNKWIASGKMKGLWQSEVGGPASIGWSGIASTLSPNYLQFLYWALTPTILGGGGWNTGNPNAFKLFWFPGYIGPNPGYQDGDFWGLVDGPSNIPTITQNGRYHATINGLLGGGNLGVFTTYESSLPPYQIPETNGVGTLGFKVGTSQYVIAFFPAAGTTVPISATISLSSNPTHVSVVDGSGNPVSASPSYNAGVLYVPFTPTGATNYLLNIQM